MIEERLLMKKAARYGGGVVSALRFFGKKTLVWDTVESLLQAAYFNGFQSGVCWQKGQTAASKKYGPWKRNPKAIAVTKAIKRELARKR